MIKVFDDVNEAIEFARSAKAVNIDRFCSLELPSIGRACTHLGLDLGFDIEEFSEVRPLLYVSYGYEGEDYYYNEIKHRGYVLRVAISDSLEEYDRFYISNRDKSKYGLSSLLLLDAPYTTFSYFKTDLVAPQNIGKATKSKILAWVDYCKKLENEKLRYFYQRRDRRNSTMEKIRKSCPVLRVREGDKVYNSFEFQPIEMTYISPDGLKICWQFGNDGSIGRSYGYDYEKADKLANSLDGNLR